MTNKLIGALQNAALYDHPVEHFDVIETHISWIILTGRFAYKIKKPVNLGFVDFSTLEKRRHYCNEELRLNRRFAPGLYLDVVDICGNPAQPRLHNGGNVIEYAIRMREFPQSDLLSSCAAEQRLQPAHIDAMADIIAGFHAQAQRAEANSVFGSIETFLKWSAENFDHIEAALPARLLPDGFDALKTWCLAPAPAQRDAIEERHASGYVRECHGDLHLGNMALIDDRVTLFDCIEFNAELRWIDIMSESAFVVMDLQARGYNGYAWRFINRYLQAGGDYAGLAILRHYLVYRALVRAKVEALRAGQHLSAQGDEAAQYRDATTYLDLAMRWSTNNRPALIIMHGLSGSGKSTLAKQLLESLGAIQLRSDIERKRLFDLKPQESSGSAISQGIYTKDATEQTYARLAELARMIINAGYTAIIDASFLKARQRTTFRQLAREHHAPFIIITCAAPAEVLRARIRQRAEQQNDPSEATLDVLEHQLSSCEALTDEEQHRSLAPAGTHPELSPEQVRTIEELLATAGNAGAG